MGPGRGSLITSAAYDRERRHRRRITRGAGNEPSRRRVFKKFYHSDRYSGKDLRSRFPRLHNPNEARWIFVLQGVNSGVTQNEGRKGVGLLKDELEGRTSSSPQFISTAAANLGSSGEKWKTWRFPPSCSFFSFLFSVSRRDPSPVRFVLFQRGAPSAGEVK